jgi:ABC-type transporter Mla subunit MlaD
VQQTAHVLQQIAHVLQQTAHVLQQTAHVLRQTAHVLQQVPTQCLHYKSEYNNTAQHFITKTPQQYSNL